MMTQIQPSASLWSFGLLGKSTGYEGIQDSLGFWIARRGFRIPGMLSVDSGFQSLVGFGIPFGVFRNQKLNIPDNTSTNIPDSEFPKQNFPDSGIRIPLHGAKGIPPVQSTRKFKTTV